MTLTIPALLALVSAAAVPVEGPQPPPRERLVVLYENRSGNPGAVQLVSDGLTGVLPRHGYQVIDDGEVRDFQRALQIASVAPLPPEALDRLLLRFRADAALLIVINFVLEAQPRARGPAANPAVGLTATVVEGDGRVRWRNSLAVLGDDVRRSEARDRSRGAIRGTVTGVCEQMFFSLPRAGPSASGEDLDAAPALAGWRRPGGPRFPLAMPSPARPRRELKEAAAGPRKR